MAGAALLRILDASQLRKGKLRTIASKRVALPGRRPCGGATRKETVQVALRCQGWIPNSV
jgi:hypothetical protein